MSRPRPPPPRRRRAPPRCRRPCFPPPAAWTALAPDVGFVIQCNGVTDWWAPSLVPYTVILDGFLNTTAATTGSVTLVETKSGQSRPTFQHASGNVQVPLTGQWFRTTAPMPQSAAGAYWIGVEFNGATVGATTLNVTGIGTGTTRGPGRGNHHRR
jgi:hypothetical protein